MLSNRYLSEVAIEKAVKFAKEGKSFISFSGRYFTPEEFREFAKKVNIDSEEIKFVDPYSVAKNGRVKLFDLLAKQFAFEKKIEDYVTGKIM